MDILNEAEKYIEENVVTPEMKAFISELGDLLDKYGVKFKSEHFQYDEYDSDDTVIAVMGNKETQLPNRMITL